MSGPSIGVAKQMPLIVDVKPESDNEIDDEPLSLEQVISRLTVPGCQPAELLSALQEHSIEAKTWPKDITAILEGVVRSAFGRSRPQNITAAGRRAMNAGEQPLVLPDDEQSTKPWKFEQEYAVEVLIWLLHHSDAALLEDNWHLITPPVLTLIDDEQTNNKIKGCKLLQILLEKVSPELWIRTGLGKVFEQALMPTLSYLPPLTPQEESLELLSNIYPTLFALCNAEFSKVEQQSNKSAMLDDLLRSGILNGLSHSKDNIDISIMLQNQLVILIGAMGIHCVKHLQRIVPILVNYLCDPFITASVALLDSTLETLQSTIVNAWPRMEHYSGDILQGLSICWVHLKTTEDFGDLSKVITKLKHTFKLFVQALGDSPMVQEIDSILEDDEELSALKS